jgi:methylated-DNA-[protein]-cysteine S-methyltransferase
MPTKFQEKVYTITKKIPRGKTMTYGEIAKILHSSPRAVGQALKVNPYAPIVPCHRVIKSDGTLGGFNGKMNSKKKIRLLKQEGVYFKEGIVQNKLKVKT